MNIWTIFEKYLSIKSKNGKISKILIHKINKKIIKYIDTITLEYNIKQEYNKIKFIGLFV